MPNPSILNLITEIQTLELLTLELLRFGDLDLVTLSNPSTQAKFSLTIISDSRYFQFNPFMLRFGNLGLAILSEPSTQVKLSLTIMSDPRYFQSNPSILDSLFFSLTFFSKFFQFLILPFKSNLWFFFNNNNIFLKFINNYINNNNNIF